MMTICNQVANPAFIGLLSYCGIVYNFIVDYFVFDTKFTTMQIVGVLIILSFNVLAGALKLSPGPDQFVRI